MQMQSIGELIDRLVIENMKIFNLREVVSNREENESIAIEAENKMNILNENRGVVIEFLDKKIENVISKKEKNVVFKQVKTYATE
jgi:hypothetical protein